MAAARSARRGLATLLATAVVVAAALALPLVGRADAHISDLTIVTVVDGVSPRLPGVTVQVAESVTAELLITNTSPTDLVVLGNGAEPFLRIGAAGVFANLASPTWYLTNSPIAVANPPASAATDAPARWAQVSVQPTWGWFEHRMHVGAGVLAQRVPRRPTTIKRWSIPVRYGTQPAIVSGRVLRSPVVGGYTARLRNLKPAVAGLGVQVSPGAVPAMFVSYAGSTPIVVIGAADEAMARLGPSGTEVNLRSRTWIDNMRARDQDVSGLVADPTAPAMWSRISGSTTLTWLDPRGVTDRGPGRNQTSRLVHWTVPIDTAAGRSLITVESGVRHA